MSPTATVTKEKKEQLLNQLEGLKLLGEVISWQANGPHPYSVVKQALKDSDLDDSVAHERLPQHAFARAARSLSKGRVIDILKQESSDIVFQFTKKGLIGDTEEGGDQWQFYKEAKVRLNKITGKVSCAKHPELEEKAQAELDKHIEQRTTSDISNIIQRQFQGNADLIPVREQGGVYLVPIEQQPFVLKIEGFLRKLGGRITRLPVPAGTNYGDANFQECMTNYLKDMTTNLSQSIENFTATSRPSTLTALAEQINANKMKIKAYAHYLKENSEELLAFQEECQKQLVTKLAQLSTTPRVSTNGDTQEQGEES